METLPASLKKNSRAARPGTGGITLADVARLAGVSAITVSRALNTPAAVSASTLERVRSAISRSGYVPNLVAGGLASNRSRLVAALVPTIAGPVFLETIQALEDRGHQLKFSYNDENRVGDHICYISDLGKIHLHFPEWQLEYGLARILDEIVEKYERDWPASAANPLHRASEPAVAKHSGGA